MSKEYIIWGKSPKDAQDNILHTKSKTAEEAEKITTILADEHGCFDMRIQIIDLSKPLDWEGEVKKALK
jgi:hypothetical protein